MTSMARLLRAAALILLGAALPATAQETALRGSVKDMLGSPLPGASITAINTGSGREFAATTNEKGQFEIKGVAAGSYRVSARMSGFSQSGKSVTLAAGQALQLEFTLDLGGLTEEITVTAAKGERAVAEVNQIVTVVSSAEIEDRRPQGTQQAFERAPNVRSIDTNPYRERPQFRGFSNSRILLVVDGERLNNGRYDVAASGITPSTIDVTQIQSIEVVGGAASSLYGSDAIAGTINIITKTADRPASGQTLDLKGNFDFNSNSHFVRGNLAATLAGPKYAVRGAFSDFDQPNYKSGGDPINRADVVRLGQFISEGGATPGVGRSIAATYAVYDLPAKAEVVNGKANGYTFNGDVSFFPTDKQSIRVKYLQNRFNNLGLPFSSPPYDTFLRLSNYSDFDKVSGRYEVKELASWLPRVALSGYWQQLQRPQNDIGYSIVSGSSYVGNTLTGNLSQFTLASNTETINDITSKGFDLQFNLAPVKNLSYITGVGYVKDLSVDTFNRSTYAANPCPQPPNCTAGATLSSVTGAKTTPDTDYKNLGWYNQLEWTPVKEVKLSGGFRVDNWKTEGKPSKGFPAGSEYAVIQASLPQIIANPGSIVVAGIQGVDQLVAGTGSLKTNVTTTTWNAGASFLLPGGIHPYLRYATSFREPEITVRYLVRDFGSPVISIPSLPNTTIKPETGKNIDTGVKVERERTRVQLGYFHNELTNAVANVFSPNYCIPTNNAAGILLTPFPPCVLTGRHSVQFFQRVNVPGKVIVQGFEGAGEVSIPLGSKGSLNPFVSVGWQKGRQTVPDPTGAILINKYYNRSDTPIKLEGGKDCPVTVTSTTTCDYPYSELPAWTGTFALKYTSPKGKWWAEYEWRFASQITRIDPNAVFSVNFPLYGGLKSYEGYNRHSIRGGVSVGEKVPVKLTLGLENLANATYFMPFQNGMSPGFSAVFGATIGWKKAF